MSPSTTALTQDGMGAGQERTLRAAPRRRDGLRGAHAATRSTSHANTLKDPATQQDIHAGSSAPSIELLRCRAQGTGGLEIGRDGGRSCAIVPDLFMVAELWRQSSCESEKPVVCG